MNGQNICTRISSKQSHKIDNSFLFVINKTSYLKIKNKNDISTKKEELKKNQKDKDT